MAQIIIDLGNIDDSPSDFVIASLKTKDKNYVLDSQKIECLSPGDVEYEEVEIGFLNTTNASWTDEQVEKMCKERHNLIMNANLQNSPSASSDKSSEDLI